VALKILVPVLPSERFYDGVVAAGDLLAREGGTITFFFTKLRPPPGLEEGTDVGFDGELGNEADLEVADDAVDVWKDQMSESLAEARDLLRERGIGEEQVTTRFADVDMPPAQAIADEAAAGGFDMVVLPRGAMHQLPEVLEGGAPLEIVEAVQELAEDGVRLLVT
jgi:hypothetical protein